MQLSINHSFKLFILLLCALWAGSAVGQDKKAYKYFEKAKEYLREEDEGSALKELAKAVERSPEFTEAWVVLADIHYRNQRIDDAVVAYESAIRTGKRSDYVYFRLGCALHESSRFNDALVALDAYVKSPGAREAYTREAFKRMAQCEFALASMADPADYNPRNLGAGVNSEDWEYFPALTANGERLVFTRRSTEKPKKDEDFWFSMKEGANWGPALPLPGQLNSAGNEGALTLSSNGRILIFAACQRPDGYGSCDLYISFNRGDNLWSAPRNLGPAVNTRAWESQPTLSADGKILVFVRGPNHTAENLELMQARILDDGSLEAAVPLAGAVNTPFQEDSPFLHYDNQTLYFSSNGHLGIGGKDFFMSKKNPDGSWGKPVNLGWPINTPGDEFSLIVGPDGKTGYFASTDFEGNLGHMDLYAFDLPEAVQAQEVAYVEGTITDAKTGLPLRTNLTFTDLKTGDVVLTTTSDGKGYYFGVLPGNTDYALTIEQEGYLFFSANFALSLETAEKAYQLNAPLQPLETGRTLALQNIFFAYDSDVLEPTSFPELKKVVALLTTNPEIRVEIGGHTDSDGDAAYNEKLSQRRANSVKQYLVDQGISSSRLTTKGYGESLPVASNETEEGKRKNRRTELRVL